MRCPLPDYTYDVATGRYRLGTQEVSINGVRAAVDQVIAIEQERTLALTERLRTGEIKLHVWEAQMQDDLKALHIATIAIAHGGRAQMGASEYGALGSTIRTQYGYLSRFAIDVAAGYQPLNGTLGTRAALYTEAARGSFWQQVSRDQARRGMTEARRMLNASDHCPGCVSVAARGWVPLGELAPIGSQDCKSRCRCDVEYRKSPEHESDQEREERLKAEKAARQAREADAADEEGDDEEENPPTEFLL
jgi:hypothetical protein